MMKSAHNPNPLPFKADSDDAAKRRHGRLRCEDLRCSIVKIQNLSASGMRILHKGRDVAQIGDHIEIIIEYLDACMAVEAKLVHASKVGFRKYTYGFEFVNLSDKQRDRLNALARVASDTLSFAKPA